MEYVASIDHTSNFVIVVSCVLFSKVLQLEIVPNTGTVSQKQCNTKMYRSPRQYNIPDQSFRRGECLVDGIPYIISVRQSDRKSCTLCSVSVYVPVSLLI